MIYHKYTVFINTKKLIVPIAISATFYVLFHPKVIKIYFLQPHSIFYVGHFNLKACESNKNYSNVFFYYSFISDKKT